METQEEQIELLKKSIITLQVCINDLHERISQVEKPTSNKTEHYFYSKDSENGTWFVKCAKTGGTFSTQLWIMESIQKQKCPCCGNSVRREN